VWQTDVHNHEDNDLVGDNWQTQRHAYVKQNVITRVYFRPLKKGVVLPLAIVKKG